MHLSKKRAWYRLMCIRGALKTVKRDTAVPKTWLKRVLGSQVSSAQKRLRYVSYLPTLAPTTGVCWDIFFRDFPSTGLLVEILMHALEFMLVA